MEYESENKKTNLFVYLENILKNAEFIHATSKFEEDYLTSSVIKNCYDFLGTNLSKKHKPYKTKIIIKYLVFIRHILLRNNYLLIY